jgi:hypothetical protein
MSGVRIREYTPELQRRDETDIAVCDMLIGLLYEAARYNLLGAFKPEELARWVQLRTVSFCSMRSTGLADDDTPIAILVSPSSTPAEEEASRWRREHRRRRRRRGMRVS